MKEWLDQDPDNARLLAEESFILEATESIWEAMENQALTKAKLAEKAGCSRALISQLLSGSRNMTLRTYAQLCFALGLEPKISASNRNEAQIWEPAADWGFEFFEVRMPRERRELSGNVYPIRSSVGVRAPEQDARSERWSTDEANVFGRTAAGGTC